MATGYFRKTQAECLGRILAETRQNGMFRVLLIHHSPIVGASSFRRRLVGASLFREIVRQHGADLILHGHTHLPTLAWIEGKDGAVPVVGVAAAGQSPGGPKPSAQYNLFEINGAAGDRRAVLRRFGLGDRRGQMVELSSTELFGKRMEMASEEIRPDI
jgi:3',5'-cyclic AMP phosphodiesterase CpdA